MVAVFEVENAAGLPAADLPALTRLVASELVAGGRFRVVPSSELRAALAEKKAESYEACYDEACQIEIGKEVAAAKTLSTSVSKLGSTCLVTLQLFDLRTSAAERASTRRGACDLDAVVTALLAAVGELSGAPAADPAPRATAPLPGPSPVVAPRTPARGADDQAPEGAARSAVTPSPRAEAQDQGQASQPSDGAGQARPVALATLLPGCPERAALQRLDGQARRLKRERVAKPEELKRLASAAQPLLCIGAGCKTSYGTLAAHPSPACAAYAGCRLAQVYEAVAGAIHRMALPKKLSEEQADMYRAALEDKTEPLLARAAEARAQAAARSPGLACPPLVDP